MEALKEQRGISYRDHFEEPYWDTQCNGIEFHERTAISEGEDTSVMYAPSRTVSTALHNSLLAHRSVPHALTLGLTLATNLLW